ncbi:MAG TPA: hypothetical protein VF753_08185 [Terriglobales bacterium]
MIRRSIIVVSLLLAAACMLWAAKDSVQEMEAKADAAPLGDRPPLYIDAAEQQLSNAIESYKAGKPDAGHAAVDDILRLTGKARDTAMQSGKRLKNTEISMRKIADRLRDLQRTLNYDDQPPVKAAADRLETMRNDLLTYMFSKGKQ